MRWLLPTIAMCVLALTARADIPTELRGRPVVEVTIVGPMARTTRARDVGIPLGVPLTRTLLRRSVRRLLATGRYANVQVDVAPAGTGARILVSLVPRLVLVRVDVVGNDFLDDDEVLRSIQLREGSEIEPRDLSAIGDKVRAAYEARGYEAVNAELVLRDTDDPARKLLVIQIAEGDPTRILHVVFDGETPPDGSGVRSEMNVDVGDLLDREEVTEAARRGERRLREAGYLEGAMELRDIHRASGGVVLVYQSRVGPRYRVEIRGRGPLSRDDILDELRVGEEPLGRGSAELMEARVADLVHRRGFPDATATIRRVALPPQEVRPRVDDGPVGFNAAGGGQRATPEPLADALLRVDLRRGESVEVVARAYPGARHFDADLLDEQFDAFLEEAIDLDSPFDPVDDQTSDLLLASSTARRERPRRVALDAEHIWYPPAYEAAAEHVQELYRADGFLAAEVGPVTVDRLEGGRAVVAIPVFEGPRTTLHGVQLTGNEALGARAILTAAGLERDQHFSYLALEQAKERIIALYRAEGYFYASVEQEVLFSEDRTRAEVRLRVIERFLVRVGEVLIEGAVRTSESLITRLAAVREGELLTPRAMRRTQDRLLDLGVFSSVNVSPADADLPARVKPVIITVTERRTQYLEFRGGVSTAQGARFGVEYGIRNIRGTALEVALRAQFGYQFFFLDDTLEQRFDELSLADRLERRVALTLAAPFIGLPNVRASLSVSNLREIERNFGLDANAVDLTLGWRPLRSLSLSLSGDLENNEIAVLGGETYEQVLQNTSDPRLRSLLRVPEGTSTLVATSLTGTLDYRDNPFVPTRGFVATGTFEWAKTIRGSEVERGGVIESFESHHLRLLLSASGYIPLGKSVVFATQLQLGRVVHLDSTSQTYPNRKFFLGGVDTIRGYLQDSLIPQDIADEVCRMSPEGGCVPPADFNVNAVVQGGDVFMVLRGELRFPIYGSVLGGAFVDLGNSWVDPSRLNPFNLRPTAGFGLRISTPVGPIAFDYGFLLLRRRYLSEPIGSFHFSIGLF